jgi:ABC-2 type transport system ATP-binding protein
LLSEIELICDRIAILNRGSLVRVGTVQELLETHDEFEISARNVAAGIFPDHCSSDGILRIAVAADAQRATIEKIWASGGEVLTVAPVRRTLEEMFLSLTGEGK